MSRIYKSNIAGLVLVLAFLVLACTGCANNQFRKTLDKYESLVDTYSEFVEKYGKNPEYGTYPEAEFMELMSEWAEVTAEVNKIDTNKLSEDDLLYFTKVISRVALKLGAIESGSLQTGEADSQQNVAPATKSDISQQDSAVISDGTEEQNADTWQYYSNSKEGISFSFPSDWSLSDSENDTKNIFTEVLSAPEEEGFSANMSVSRNDNDEVADFMMTCTKAELELLYSQTSYGNMKLYDLVDFMIDGVSVRMQRFAFDATDPESSFSGRFIDVMYTYVYNDSFYVIRCATLENLSEKYLPIFDGIMATYTIF